MRYSAARRSELGQGSTPQATDYQFQAVRGVRDWGAKGSGGSDPYASRKRWRWAQDWPGLLKLGNRTFKALTSVVRSLDSPTGKT
jgi:hypothetical protein